MLTLPIGPAWAQWLIVLSAVGPLLIAAKMVYNVYFHPLRRVPGPFWAAASGIPSFLHARTGKRHIWLWQQFEIYGNTVRVEPNTVLFKSPQAYSEIYGMKRNVRRSKFYEAFSHHGEVNTLIDIDVAGHAKKRKLLNLCFTDKLVRAATNFVIEHVDRWHELIGEEIGSDDWSHSINFSDRIDNVIFDIMGDLSFGCTYNTKEPGENPLKSVSRDISKAMEFYYPLCRSPLLSLLLWAKPRGLDALFDYLSPPGTKEYTQFVTDSVSQRLQLHKEQQSKPLEEQRQDLFYFLCSAVDPDTGKPAYTEPQLRMEARLLVVAGSDTTAINLSSIFFNLTNDPWRYQKLVDEILSTFSSADEIVHGPKISECVYLRACIDEAMRITPSGPSELPREVLEGGITILGDYYPPGTIVGCSAWVDSRNQDVYGDPEVYRPERWIVDEATNVTKEDVNRARANFHPFTAGPGQCVGKALAMAELLIIVARTLYRYDVRRTPGSTLGGGSPDMGWGARDYRQMQVGDAYLATRKGPEVQFRKRFPTKKA